jgi:hypothetical protein
MPDKMNRTHINARRTLRRVKLTRFDRESGTTASLSMPPPLAAAESNPLPIEAASRPYGTA